MEVILADIIFNIKEVRKKKGLTQGDLGKKLGYTTGHVSSLERGAKNLYFKDAIKIAEALNCSLYDLIPEVNQKQLKIVSNNPNPMYVDKDLLLSCIDMIKELEHEEVILFEEKEFWDIAIELYIEALKLKDESGKINHTKLIANLIKRHSVK